MKKIIFTYIILFLILFFSCSTNEKWKPSDEEKKELLEKLVEISKETAYPSSEFSEIKLWWDHPDVAILHFKLTGYSNGTLLFPKTDTLKSTTISVFIHTEEGWKFRRSIGQVY